MSEVDNEDVDQVNDLPGMCERRGSSIPRFWEIDYFRGVAIVMMIIFHVAFDMAYFGIVNLGVHTAPWRALAVCTASLFLLLVGISLTLSSARAQKTLKRRDFLLKYLRRGAGIMGLGFLLTLLTLILVPKEPILFGILHLIGFSVILSTLFIRYTWVNFFAGLGAIFVGWRIEGIPGPSCLLWLGVHPPGFTSLDYTPVFPWIGAVLIGVWLGHLIYPGGQRRSGLSIPQLPCKDVLCYAGRHSLVIYLLHQPVIILIIIMLWSPAGIFPLQ